MTVESASHASAAKAGGAASSLTRAALVLATLVIVGQCVGAFIGLGASSFWVDELHTAWTIDVGGWDEVWRRVIADVHPPGYLLVAHAWIKAFGLNEVSLRSLSALSSVAAVAILVLGSRHRLSLGARLLVGVAAVSSAFWLEQSQNGRMYGLGMMFGALLAVLALQIVASIGGGRPVSTRQHILLLLAGFVAASIHFYLFLAVGTVYLGLLLLARNWRDRVILVLGGLLIASTMLVYIKLLLSNTFVDVKETHFINGKYHFAEGILNSILYSLGVGGLVLLAVAGLMAVPRIVSHRKDRAVQQELMAPALLLFVPFALIVAGIVVSLVVAPSFSGRNVSVSTPFIWLGFGCLFDLATSHLSPLLRAIALLTGAVVSMVNGHPVLDRLAPQRSEYRASAEAIRKLRACAGQPIPILLTYRTEKSPLVEDVGRYGYGYYLRASPERPPRNPLLINYVEDGERFRYSPATRSLIAGRLSGRDPCPVLAWVVNTYVDDEKSFVRSIAEAGGAADAPIRVIHFAHIDRKDGRPAVAARIVVADRSGGP